MLFILSKTNEYLAEDSTNYGIGSRCSSNNMCFYGKCVNGKCADRSCEPGFTQMTKYGSEYKCSCDQMCISNKCVNGKCN